MTVIIDGTYGISPAQWTTSGRPSSPALGQQGYNTTLNQTEVYSGLAWIAITTQTYSASYLIVAGGGGGGSTQGSYNGGGGGGGAGGF